jgi:menaquinone-specific isochorismate synthase
VANSILSEKRLGLLYQELLRAGDHKGETSPIGATTASSECSPVSPLEWLSNSTIYPRMYWSSRDGQFEIAGCGSAWSVSENDSDSISERLDEISDLLVNYSSGQPQYAIGGVCFDPAAGRDTLWKDFPALWFVLPKIALVRDGSDYRIHVSARPGDTFDLDRVREYLYTANSFLQSGEHLAGGQSAYIVDRTDKPDRTGWVRMVERAVDEIGRETIDKVVLGRRSDLRLSSDLAPVSFLSELKQANAGCYGVMLEPRPGAAFVSASPERLFKMERNSLRSEAIAGTIKRSEDDHQSEEQLLASSKDRVEQRYVIDGVLDNLRDLSRTVRVDEQPEILRLPNVFHLRSRISAELNENVRFTDVLRALHPTAAVCGLPRSKAHDLIRVFEPFDRGWYAGAVGCISGDTSEFAVAIRSALIHNMNVSLFAGAGIVAQSSPDSEWRELEHKLATAMQPLAGVQV